MLLFSQITGTFFLIFLKGGRVAKLINLDIFDIKVILYHNFLIFIFDHTHRLVKIESIIIVYHSYHRLHEVAKSLARIFYPTLNWEKCYSLYPEKVVKPKKVALIGIS